MGAKTNDIPTPKDAERTYAPKKRAKFLAECSALREQVIKEIDKQYPNPSGIIIDTDGYSIEAIVEVCSDLRSRGWDTTGTFHSPGGPGIKIVPAQKGKGEKE